jgi:predicted ATPase
MEITHLKLRNWRNFADIDFAIGNRLYVIGPNAVGKSNLLDAFRFLRDIAQPGSGGLQDAVSRRGGIGSIRSLSARSNPRIRFELEFRDDSDESEWGYVLEVGQQPSGKRAPIVHTEAVTKGDETILKRPTDADQKDVRQLTQTHLEQVGYNKNFREIQEYLAKIRYMHIVPQMLRYSEELAARRVTDDPFGQGFLEQIAQTNEKTRTSRLRRLQKVLRVCVPQLEELKFLRDEKNGRPHLEAKYKHWRPHGAYQREELFSDGTLRLLGLAWSLMDGDGLLLLEEPEISLNSQIVSKIPRLLRDVQRETKRVRQILVTTHSESLLGDAHIGLDEVLRLEPSDNGTKVASHSADDKTLVKAGASVGETLLPKTRPNIGQIPLFD